MKNRFLLMALGLAALAAAGVGGGLWLRGAMTPAAPTFLQETVQASDIEAAVTAMGALDLDAGVVRAAISEVDIAKVGIGKAAYFTRVGVLDQHYGGRVMSMTAMPAAFVAAQEEASKAAREALARTRAQPAAEEPTDEEADVEPQLDEFADQGPGDTPKDQPRTSVFYNVVFRIDNPSQMPAVPSVMVHVVQGVAKQVPAISRLALQGQLGENRYRVEVVDKKGRLTPREIVTGLTDDLLIEVRSGLALGEVVAIKTDPSLYEPGYR